MNGTIPLRPDAADIEAVYFRNGYFDPWRSTGTEWARRVMLGGLVASVVVLVAGALLRGPLVVLLIVALLVAGVPLGVFWRSSRMLRRSKERIRRFAHDVAAAGPAELRLTEKGFSLTHGQRSKEVPWSAVRSGSCAPDVVFLHADTCYLFPRASMPPEAFEPLVRHVRRHVPVIDLLP